MFIFDSHCHLDDRAYHDDLTDVILAAHKMDVRAMMVVGIDAESSSRAVALADQHESLFASVGLHPHDAQSCGESVLEQLRLLAGHPKVHAWGETGLDFNRMYSPQKDQEHWFIRQLEIANELDLPMIFHERDSRGRFLQILKAHWRNTGGGVVHCFSGTSDELAAYLEMDLYIGVTGILTMKDRGKTLREMVGNIPSNRLLVETDAPYLTPSPERNKHRRNEPAFVRTVLLKLAQVIGVAPETLAATIWENAYRLFRLP